MTLNDYLLLGLVQYGLPILFGVIVLASIGVPLPATLLVLTAGAFVAQGDLQLWSVVGVTTGAAMLGDHVGYGVGRWGSQPLIGRLSGWGGGAARMAQAEQAARRWGGLGIFLSRWLITPIGPVINITSGIARYPWPIFFCFDLAGELLWAGLYIVLGQLFSDQVQTLSETLGNFAWVIVGLLVIALLLRALLRPARPATPAAPPQPLAPPER